MRHIGANFTRVGRIFPVVVLLLLPTLTAAQQTNSEVMYFVQGERYPKGLNDFQAFGLSRKEKQKGKPHYTGWVMANRGDPNSSTSEMKSIRLTGPRLEFMTTTTSGYRMTFKGRFLHSGDLTRFFQKDVPVVEGIVRKFHNGRKIAEGKMRFTCGLGG